MVERAPSGGRRARAGSASSRWSAASLRWSAASSRPRAGSASSASARSGREAAASSSDSSSDDAEDTALEETTLTEWATDAVLSDGLEEVTLTVHELFSEGGQLDRGVRHYCCHSRHHAQPRSACVACRVGFCVALLALPTFSFTAKIAIFGKAESDTTSFATMYERAYGENDNDTSIADTVMDCNRTVSGRRDDCWVDVTVNQSAEWPLVTCPLNSLGWERIRWHVIDPSGAEIPLAEATVMHNCSTADAYLNGCVDLDDTKIWCGMVPHQYIGYWTNIGQMIIFTVFLDLSTTVQLAWQGLAGITIAAINRMLMALVYPEGGQGPFCTEERVKALVCKVPHAVPYNELVCLLDVLFIIILFLASKANDNIIKFGISWHVYLMMEFMNPSIGVSWGYWPVPGAPLLPDIDSSTSMVIGTSIVGCVVSVLLMLPRNVPSLCDDIAKITDEMSKVWQESMDYLCGLTGSIGHESRHTLATRISWLMSEHASLKARASQAWWCTFECGRSGAVQRLAQAYTKDTAEAMDILEAVRRCLLNQSLSMRPVNFGAAVRRPLFELVESTRSTRKLSADLIMLRQHSRRRFKEKTTILTNVIDKEMSQLDRRRAAVLEAASKASPFPSRTTIPMHLIYPFLVTSWASAMAACAKRIEELAQQEEDAQGATALRSFVLRVAAGLDPRMQIHHFTSMRLKFFAIVRNTTSIFVCFVIGHYCMASNSTMAGTLSLLLIRKPGRVVDRNIQRLIAVAMSSSLPMCIVWLLDASSITECGSWGRTIAQGISMWGFVGIFVYIYYSDTQWAFPAVLIAGLGITPLMKTCPAISGDDALTAFDTQKQVVFALTIQMVVDTMIMWGHTPPLVAEKRFRRVGDILVERYGRLFDSDPTAVTLDALTKLEGAFEYYRSLLPSIDPKTGLIYRDGARFHFRCHKLATECISSLLANLKIMSIAVSERDSETDVAAEDAQHAAWLASKLEAPEAQVALGAILEFVKLIVKAIEKCLQTHGDRRDCEEVISELESFAVDMQGLEQLFRYLEALDHERPAPRCRLAMIAWSLQDAVNVLTSAQEELLRLVSGPDSRPGILEQ